MKSPRDTDDGSELSERELSHNRHRDTKRHTKMVVDNAAVKKLAPAVAEKRRRERETRPES